jgi:endonuclease/exonuclease/phosphatase family metal-dependent hydrolase
MADADARDPLRIATFNVRTGIAPEHRPSRLWLRRRAAVASALADLDADVIGLQEVHGFQLRRLARAMPGYRFVAATPRGRWVGERCPVLIREQRLRVLAEHVAWFVDGGLDPHAAGERAGGAHHPRILSRVVLVDDRTGRELVVLNVHLATEASARRAAVAHVAAAVGGGDTILLGDFNATADDPDLAPLAAAGLTRIPVTGATFHRWSGSADGAPIDHLFVSAGWEVVGARVDRSRPGGRLPSDHWPVVADVVQGRARRRRPPAQAAVDERWSSISRRGGPSGSSGGRSSRAW